MKQKKNILGVHFSPIGEGETISFLLKHNYNIKSYVCFPSTDTIALANNDEQLKHILNSALLTLPDGKVTEFLARIKRIKGIHTNSGLVILKALLKSDLSHFFYGLNEADLKIFKSKIIEMFPDAKILGFKSPPFVELHEIKNNKKIIKDINDIKTLGPDLVWIGISTPKQEYIANYYLPNLDKGVIVCVGAVFLYMAELIDPGPAWVKKLGIKWFYRLIQEPKRLWKHTLKFMFNFMLLLIKDLISSHRGSNY